MGSDTKIAWTDATWNPIRGCSVVSEGCKNCYAMGVAARFNGEGQPYEGLAFKSKDGHPHWTGKIMLVEKHLYDPLRWQKPKMVFVNSMSDVFHPDVPFEYIDLIFGVMALAQKHTFQVLTKRPERMAEYMNFHDRFAKHPPRDLVDRIGRAMNVIEEKPIDTPRMVPGWGENPLGCLPNVWMGTSVELQKWADERIPHLLRVPAVVRFLSCEPLLGPLNLEEWIGEMDCAACRVRFAGDPCPSCGREDGDGEGIVGFAENAVDAYPDTHWVIVGGESGPYFRPMNKEWARSLRDQCQAAGVAFFYKQSSAFRSETDPYLDGMQYHEFPEVRVAV
jgi:protein gp37